jgi:hypothetical protein
VIEWLDGFHSKFRFYIFTHHKSIPNEYEHSNSTYKAPFRTALKSRMAIFLKTTHMALIDYTDLWRSYPQIKWHGLYLKKIMVYELGAQM